MRGSKRHGHVHKLAVELKGLENTTVNNMAEFSALFYN